MLRIHLDGLFVKHPVDQGLVDGYKFLLEFFSQINSSLSVSVERRLRVTRLIFQFVYYKLNETNFV